MQAAVPLSQINTYISMRNSLTLISNLADVTYALAPLIVSTGNTFLKPQHYRAVNNWVSRSFDKLPFSLKVFLRCASTGIK